MASVDSPNTTLWIDRVDGERLVLDGLGLARGFFTGDRSSVGAGSYDTLAGKGERDRITIDDVQAINRTMRARSKHQSWESVRDRDLPWLSALDPTLDLIVTSEREWRVADGEGLAIAALTAAIGPHRGPSVATKILHLKRPCFFPILDDLVAGMLGVNMPDDVPPGRRAAIAVHLLLHLRAQGRANLEALRNIQALLEAEGITRPLVRILDATIWFAHPAAGVPGVMRDIAVIAGSR